MQGKLWMMGVFSLLGAAVCAAQTKPVEGNWRTPTGAIIQVYSCGEAECLKLVQLEPGSPYTVDGKNPDLKLQTRPLCGLEIGSGFKPLEDGKKADGGSLYDPKSGKTYSGVIAADGDQLKLRGFVGLKVFGRSEQWSRVKETVSVCK